MYGNSLTENHLAASWLPKSNLTSRHGSYYLTTCPSAHRWLAWNAGGSVCSSVIRSGPLSARSRTRKKTSTNHNGRIGFYRPLPTLHPRIEIETLIYAFNCVNHATSLLLLSLRVLKQALLELHTSHGRQWGRTGFSAMGSTNRPPPSEDCSRPGSVHTLCSPDGREMSQAIVHFQNPWGAIQHTNLNHFPALLEKRVWV